MHGVVVAVWEIPGNGQLPGPPIAKQGLTYMNGRTVRNPVHYVVSSVNVDSEETAEDTFLALLQAQYGGSFVFQQGDTIFQTRSDESSIQLGVDDAREVTEASTGKVELFSSPIGFIGTSSGMSGSVNSAMVHFNP